MSCEDVPAAKEARESNKELGAVSTSGGKQEAAWHLAKDLKSKIKQRERSRPNNADAHRPPRRAAG